MYVFCGGGVATLQIVYHIKCLLLQLFCSPSSALSSLTRHRRRRRRPRDDDHSGMSCSSSTVADWLGGRISPMKGKVMPQWSFEIDIQLV